jgi:photosystem II stability/assembly factor-like uncharacterized protein
MWKRGISLSAVIWLILYLVVAAKADVAISNTVWRDVSRGIRDLDLRAVAVSPDEADTVYIGSSSAIFKTIDGGKEWDNVLSFRGIGNAINSIAINPMNTRVVYAGTQDGLYRSKDQGRNWERVFRGIGGLESHILSVAINPLKPEVIFVGTYAGLFRIDDGGSNWRKDQNLPSETVVSSIAIHPSEPHIVYAATDRGLYKSIDNGMDWERVLVTTDTEDGNILDQVDAKEINDGIETEIKGVVVDLADAGTVYLGTAEGLIITEDGGLTWMAASSSGLISRNIHHLVVSSTDPDGVYAATSRGVFRYSKSSKRWMELYKGLTSIDIRFLAFEPLEPTTLWAATKGGVFKTIAMIQNATFKDGEVEAEELLSIFADEPSIGEIQKAAISYAEVYPEKIERWRKAAAKRAWLPDLRVSYDEDWQSSGYFYSGTYRDDDITRGDDWSVSLTWKLGDLIWNDDQTSIDTRSRLMVQLRDDVLNEVTRLYFERRRLQIKMLHSPSKEIMDKVEKKLRLQELTADIDALTGFYLSRRLVRGKRQNKTRKISYK